jgi:hypothetical protein
MKDVKDMKFLRGASAVAIKERFLVQRSDAAPSALHDLHVEGFGQRDSGGLTSGV